MEETKTYPEASEILIEKCKKGDPEAFKTLYVNYSKAMFNVCMRILNNREESEDVLQESFISAFKNISQYKGSASIGSWLKRIVINRSIDALKKRNPDLIPLKERDLPEEAIVEDSLNYTVENIKKGIRELPDGYRIILTLYLFEDFTHKMIAEKLGISEGTSKSQYARAKKKLVERITLKKPGS